MVECHILDDEELRADEVERRSDAEVIVKERVRDEDVTHLGVLSLENPIELANQEEALRENDGTRTDVSHESIYLHIVKLEASDRAGSPSEEEKSPTLRCWFLTVIDSN